MTRSIVHADFYKTDTTPLRAYFEENAARLKGRCYSGSKSILQRRFGQYASIDFRSDFPSKVNVRERANSNWSASKAGQVHLSFLEETTPHPHGQAKALFDLLDLPAEHNGKRPPAQQGNIGISVQLRDMS